MNTINATMSPRVVEIFEDLVSDEVDRFTQLRHSRFYGTAVNLNRAKGLVIYTYGEQAKPIETTQQLRELCSALDTLEQLIARVESILALEKQRQDVVRDPAFASASGWIVEQLLTPVRLDWWDSKIAATRRALVIYSERVDTRFYEPNVAVPVRSGKNGRSAKKADKAARDRELRQRMKGAQGQKPQKGAKK